MIRVTHVIDGLSVGGAETMLANVVRRMDEGAFRSEVISLTDIGAVGRSIEATGTPVRALGLAPTPLRAARALQLPRMIRSSRPDVVQTWLYHGDLLGGIATRLAIRGVPVIWGVHRSDLDAGWTKSRLAVAARLCAAISSRVPTLIVSCSDHAARSHVALGYDDSRMVVIPNGFDLGSFHPDADARQSVRYELGIPVDAPLIGMVARFDPTKDHATMLRAAARVTRSHPDAHFILCGAGVESDNTPFAALLYDGPAASNVHLMGVRRDIARIDAALDVAVLSSRSEALPLSIGEAMASGVPCVVTDVGDAAALVGETGSVVPPGDADQLAKAIESLLERSPAERQALGTAARARIERNYEIGDIVTRYEALYREVVNA